MIEADAGERQTRTIPAMDATPAPARSACIALAAALALAHGAGHAQTQVQVHPAEATAVEETLVLSGTLSAQRSARLSPRVDGLVSAVGVDAGDRVEAGQPLLRLDPALAEAALAREVAAHRQAQVARAEAARRVEEAERLVAERHVPQTELAARRAALAEAEAAVRAASAQEREQRELVERHRLDAPFAGVIAARDAEAGEWVVRGDAVLHLVALDPVRLDVQAPQERFTELRPDTPVEILPDAMPGTVLAARIAARVPVSIESGARTFLVRVVAEAGEHGLLPGTSASARFRLVTPGATAVRIPRDALLRHPDGGYSVFVVEDGVARRRTVRLGREAADAVEIAHGITAGEAVVVRGNEALREDEPVRVVAPQG
jgi:RND family efflux transporter MFP subunit